MPDNKVLVVYYSHSGNTRTVGRAIAERLHADTEELVDLRQKQGAQHFLLGGFKGFFRLLTRIGPVQRDPAAYDLVVVGSPVYAGKMASPVRTYLAQQKAKLSAAAFFVTAGDPENPQAVDEMAVYAGVEARGKLVVPAASVPTGEFRARVEAFCAQL